MKTINKVKTDSYKLESSLHKIVEGGNMHPRTSTKRQSLGIILLGVAMGIILPVAQALAKGGTCSGGCGGNSYQGKMMSEYAYRIYPEAKQNEIAGAEEIRKTIQNISKVNPRYGKELEEAARGLVLYLLPGLENKKLAESITGLKIDTDQEALHNGESEVLQNKEKFSAKALESKVHFLMQELIEEHLSKRYSEEDVKKLHANARKFADLLAPARGNINEKILQDALASLNLGYYFTQTQEVKKREAAKQSPMQVVAHENIVLFKNKIPMDFSTPQTLKVGDTVRFQLEKEGIREEVPDNDLEFTFTKCWNSVDSKARICDPTKELDPKSKMIETTLSNEDASTYQSTYYFCVNGKKYPDGTNSCTHIVFNSSINKVERHDYTEAGGHDVHYLPIKILDSEGKPRFQSLKPSLKQVNIFINGQKIDSVSKDSVLSFHTIPQSLEEGDLVRVEVVADTDPSKQTIYSFEKYSSDRSKDLTSGGTSSSYEFTNNDIGHQQLNISAHYAGGLLDRSFLDQISIDFNWSKENYASRNDMDLYVNGELIDKKRDPFLFVKLGDKIKIVAHRKPGISDVTYKWRTNNGPFMIGQNSNTIEFIVDQDFFYSQISGLDDIPELSENQKKNIIKRSREDHEKYLLDIYKKNNNANRQQHIGVKVTSSRGVSESSAFLHITLAELLQISNAPAPRKIVYRLGAQVNQEKLGYLNRTEAKDLQQLLLANDQQICSKVLGRIDDFINDSSRNEIEVLLMSNTKIDDATKKCLGLVQEALPAIRQSKEERVKNPSGFTDNPMTTERNMQGR